MGNRSSIALKLAMVLIATMDVLHTQWQDLIQHPVRTSQEHGQRVIPTDIDGDDAGAL